MEVFGDGCAANALRRLLWADRSRRGLIFARFELGAILRGQNVLALEVFGGVDVPGFLVALLAGAFLPCGFRNALLLVWRSALDLVLALLGLLLGAALPSASKGDRENQDHRHTTAPRARRGRCGAQVADPGWGVKIRTWHSKPMMRGTAPRKSIPQKAVRENTDLFPVFPGGRSRAIGLRSSFDVRLDLNHQAF